MHLSAECAFPYLRKRRAVSRKDALCDCDVTEKRILELAPYANPHSATPGSRRLRLSATIAARRGRGETARQIAGYLGKWPNWANALGKPPARLRGGLRRGPQTSAWGLASRKDAFCDVTEKRILELAPYANPHSARPSRCSSSVRNSSYHMTYNVR